MPHPAIGVMQWTGHVPNRLNRLSPPSPIPTRVVCGKFILFNRIRGWFSPKLPILLNLNLKTFIAWKLPASECQFWTLRRLIALDSLAFDGTG